MSLSFSLRLHFQHFLLKGAISFTFLLNLLLASAPLLIEVDLKSHLKLFGLGQLLLPDALLKLILVLHHCAPLIEDFLLAGDGQMPALLLHSG